MSTLDAPASADANAGAHAGLAAEQSSSERSRGLMFVSDVAFTNTVKRIQAERGSRRSYERMERTAGGFPSSISADLAAFVAERDSIYIATANAAGQPYVQHRGGPAGFLNVLDDRTLAFADFVGNKQYITTGNLMENDRAFLFLMDYAHAERIKIWGRARVVTDDQALFDRLADPSYPARVEQAIVFEVEAWNANCPQHIPRLMHVDDVQKTLVALRERNAYLEATLRASNITFDTTSPIT